jgi:uncharacterized membrane protein
LQFPIRQRRFRCLKKCIFAGFNVYLRSFAERIRQSLWFEAIGLTLVTPVYLVAFGHGAWQGLGVMGALSVAVMVWSPVHNSLFDMAEYRVTGRLASDRPQGMRVVHALSHEVTAVLVTVPLLVWLGGHGWIEALTVDVLLSAFYAVYAYVFHMVYDRLRPIVVPQGGLQNGVAR